jgi:hypothetical protein
MAKKKKASARLAFLADTAERIRGFLPYGPSGGGAVAQTPSVPNGL